MRRLTRVMPGRKEEDLQREAAELTRADLAQGVTVTRLPRPPPQPSRDQLDFQRAQ
jgi:hypothetical protein